MSIFYSHEDKEEVKLERIGTSVSLPFHSFLDRNKLPELLEEEPVLVSEIPHAEESFVVPPADSSLEEIIVLEDDSYVEVIENDDSETKDSHRDSKELGSGLIMEEEEHASLSVLSTSYQKCFQSGNQNRTIEKIQKSQEPTGLLQLKPFDYAAARKRVKFGKESEEGSIEAGDKDQGSLDSLGGKKISGVQKDDGTNEFSEGERRQAFPATGNRSAPFQ
ncbi:hypothetical protein GH714_022386 [Hevea brasiliensis]|uniref:Uncharacterized protein n=1 Tax=Hevea brasiliensis TaxID=3981 RepID=A0A6A6LZQ5_HEVBR|nr:hypothetical protein GH714_022386 [Hevea brasiliensis]